MAERGETQASTKVRAIVVKPVDGSHPPFLVLEIEIACAACGGTDFQVHGHHVKALHETLAEILLEHPELCGSGGREVSRTSWVATVDPKKIGDN